MSSWRVLFCGTPQFALPSLKALAEDPEFDVGLVLTQPDRPAGRGHKLQKSPVKQAAEALNIPVESPASVNTKEVIKRLQSENFDVCVVVAFGQILKDDFLKLFANKCVNLHGSLLPRWRGAAPIQRALMAGDKRSGVSLQVVVRALDAGDVIAEAPIVLSESVSAIELHDRLSEMGAKLLTNEFKHFLKGELQPQPQDESLVTYAKKITKEETQIQWSLSAEKIHNLIRGLAMGPQAKSQCQDVSYKFHQTEVVDRAGTPGEVLENEGELIIACGEKSLKVLELQPQSKKRLAVSEFLKGSRLQRGDRFE